MLARVRNRRGIIAGVDPFDGHDGRFHMVHVEYTDSDGVPDETLLWEREIGTELLEPTAMPQVAHKAPMRSDEFTALVRSARWSALTPFLDPDGGGVLEQPPVASPFHGAVQVEDFQLVPLLKALRMPRVSLLLADDVGLGKTIEAGLVMSELLLRRRIRRVLILTPAALRDQWQQEMDEKFSLGFDVVDRKETHQLQRKLGLDANPWRTFPRIISSYYYLKQPDVLEQFRAACKQPRGTAQLPWDLLIVDEVHNLMPASYGADSDLAQMLRIISPWFEHKLFLTATPHNGHTRSFTGLLELLDPVRFTKKTDLTDTDRERIPEVVIRRLKSEINELDDSRGRTPRFAVRYPEPLPLYFSAEEKSLSQAVQTFRRKVKKNLSGKNMVASNFAVEILNKRLLSCPSAFAESWFRLKAGATGETSAELGDVSAAKRAVEEDIDDDRERESREHHAAHTVGAWLKPLLDDLAPEIEAIDDALAELGLKPDADIVPDKDSRFDRLHKAIESQLRMNNAWKDDERLIVFTEYKTTLDYLQIRLEDIYSDADTRVRVLYGGMDRREREEIKAAFNDPDDPVRILLGTDAASEGLNLQATARLLLHFDIPWNPSRLEQRNGRLDRHGQARNVTVYHFTSEDDADLKFLNHVVNKVHQIREDLGSLGELFDAAFQQRFVDETDTDSITRQLDAELKRQQEETEDHVDEDADSTVDADARLAEFRRQIDLSPDALLETLDVAMGMTGLGRPRVTGPDDDGRYKITPPVPPRWQQVVDDSLRIGTSKLRGRMPKLVFDPEAFITDVGGRPVFRPAKDAVLMHLGHPVYKRALHDFARVRFPGGHDLVSASRWAATEGPVAFGADAEILLTVEELAVNDLREPFHHWVRTMRFAVSDEDLGEFIGDVVPADDASTPADDRRDEAQELWEEVDIELRQRLKQIVEARTDQIRAGLEGEREDAIERERGHFITRIAEVKEAMKKSAIEKEIERERRKLEKKLKMGLLFSSDRRDYEERIAGLREDRERRENHYGELARLLERERDRVLELLLPRRYTLRGTVQLFPLAIEIRLPTSGGAK